MIECGKTNRSAAEIVMRKIFAFAITILITDCYVYVKKNPINIFLLFAEQAVRSFPREVRNRMRVSGTQIYPKAKVHQERKSSFDTN